MLSFDFVSDLFDKNFDLSTCPKPPCRFYEEKDGTKILAVDVPGVAKEKLRVEVKDNNIIISGERPKKENAFFSSVRDGPFRYQFNMKSFGLSGMDEDSVGAACRDGVLCVSFSEKKTNKTIKIL